MIVWFEKLVHGQLVFSKNYWNQNPRFILKLLTRCNNVLCVNAKSSVTDKRKFIS